MVSGRGCSEDIVDGGETLLRAVTCLDAAMTNTYEPMLNTFRRIAVYVYSIKSVSMVAEMFALFDESRIWAALAHAC